MNAEAEFLDACADDADSWFEQADPDGLLTRCNCLLVSKPKVLGLRAAVGILCYEPSPMLPWSGHALEQHTASTFDLVQQQQPYLVAVMR